MSYLVSIMMSLGVIILSQEEEYLGISQSMAYFSSDYNNFPEYQDMVN